MKLKFKTYKHILCETRTKRPKAHYTHYCDNYNISLCDKALQHYFTVPRNSKRFDLILTQRGKKDRTAYAGKLLTKKGNNKLFLLDKRGYWLNISTLHNQDLLLIKYFKKDPYETIFFNVRVEY